MIAVRRARPADAIAIGAVHVAAWRSAYPGILPDRFLARMSVARQAAHYDAAIRGGQGGGPGGNQTGNQGGILGGNLGGGQEGDQRGGQGVLVATASGDDVPNSAGTRIIGFATAGPARMREISGQTLGDGEVETLYVLDDWRDRGVGRMLLRAAAEHLVQSGCRSAFLWVLRDNPSRWFYQRLGGKAVLDSVTRVAGKDLAQTAYVWDPIELLLTASKQEL